jgi:hypothetical protein
MSSASADVPMSLQGETYPLMLLTDAYTLQKLAADSHLADLSEDRPLIPRLGERAAARAAIFTAFNMVESVLIDLSQACIAEDTTGLINAAHKGEITRLLNEGKGNISTTIKDWPRKLCNANVHDDRRHNYREFERIRVFRNNLIHPKLEPASPAVPDQTSLLMQCTAANAMRIIIELAQTAKVLYSVFGKPIPPEFAQIVR